MKLHAWLATLALATLPALAPVSVHADAQSDAAATPAPMPGQDGGGRPPAPIPQVGSGPNGAFSYTMGYTLGQRVAADVKDVEVDTFAAGFRDAYTGAPGKLTEDQMQQVIEAFQQRRIAEAQAAHEKLAADNLARGNAFLAKNGKRKGVKTTKSGLQYEVLAKGKGPSPKSNDMVTAHYHGTLIDGKVFDSSRDGDPVQFPLDRVIPGWNEALQLMNKGAKYKLYIPAALAYGERGAGDVIGPNEVLVFEVELIDFGPLPQEVPTGAPEESEAPPLEEPAAAAPAGAL